MKTETTSRGIVLGPRLWSILAAAGALVGLVFVGSSLAQPGPYFQAGQAIASAHRGDVGPVLAVVAGRPVRETGIQTYQALAQLNNAVSPRKIDTGRKAAFAALSRAIVVAHRGGAGAQPSGAEIDQFIAGMRQQAQGKRSDEQLDQYLAGLGRTRDDFFSDLGTRAAYGRTIAIARIKAQVTAGLTPDQALDAWAKYQSEALASAHITIIDPTLR